MPTRRGGRVVAHFLLQPGDLVLGFEQALVQRGHGAERRGPGAGAGAGRAVQIDQPLFAEDGDGVGEQLIEERHGPDADVGEGMVADGDAPAEPTEGVVFGTKDSQCASGADAFKSGVPPQADGQSGIEGGVAGPSVPGAVGQGRPVEPLAEVPDDAGLVVVAEEPADGGGVE